MKKILLASTMLVSVAGYAAADISVSGSARMGVVGSENATTFSSNVHASFSGSGTTDGGLAFGGSFDAHNASGADSGTSGSTYISGAFGKISMGSVDSGDKAAVGQLASVGYTGLGSGNSISYTADGGFMGGADDAIGWGGPDDNFLLDLVGNDGAKVLYSYSAGDLTVNASTAQLSNGGANHDAFGLGVSYTAGALTLAGGYGTNEIRGSVWDWEDDWDYSASGSITDVSASATYVMGDTTVKAIYQDKSIDVSYDAYYDDFDGELASAVSMGVSVVHKIDAISLTAYTVTTDLSSDWGGVDVSVNRLGVGATYDLGGGAKFQAGWAQIDSAYGEDAHSAFDAGVNFSF